MLRRTDRRLILSLCLIAAACGEEVPAQQRVFGGDPDEGRLLVARYGCAACHRIPALRLRDGSVGPTLEGFGRRAYIAGRLPNRPGVLTRWLRDPPQLDPMTAMPPQGVGEAEARHIAAFLYTLR